MFVKICGLTTLDDTLAAVRAGAQALGFNFVPSSPRFITETRLAQWIRDVPEHVWKVGVFADHPASEVEAICSRLGLDVAQLHGSESAAQAPQGVRVWKASRVREGFDIAELASFPAEAVLLDGPKSGIPFDWSVARSLERNVILAGGLDSANVREAIRRVRPWGVDVSSRIESSPGRKDHCLMTEFIETALSC